MNRFPTHDFFFEMESGEMAVESQYQRNREPFSVIVKTYEVLPNQLENLSSNLWLVKCLHRSCSRHISKAILAKQTNDIFLWYYPRSFSDVLHAVECAFPVLGHKKKIIHYERQRTTTIYFCLSRLKLYPPLLLLNLPRYWS